MWARGRRGLHNAIWNSKTYRAINVVACRIRHRWVVARLACAACDGGTVARKLAPLTHTNANRHWVYASNLHHSRGRWIRANLYYRAAGADSYRQERRSATDAVSRHHFTRDSAGSEQGLLSVAFPPGFASKGYFFVDYTDMTGIGNTVIARYHVTANPDVADPNSEETVLGITQPYANHNGGQLQFGPDGYLYIGMGDGGSGGDPQNNAQTPSMLLGKILRIDTEQTAPPSPPSGGSLLYYFPVIAKTFSIASYTVPATNPYTQTAGYRGEIWALGLRNPWRFSFDRSTGDLYIADVGQNAWEEVDFQSASSAGGENYGWRILEGTHCYNPSSGCVPPARYSAPVAEYSHSFGCSVTGGYVYRGPGNAAMQGIYFYGDYCSGRIWGLQNAGGWQTQQLAQPSINISTFGEDEAGNLYVASYSGGATYQITTP